LAFCMAELFSNTFEMNNWMAQSLMLDHRPNFLWFAADARFELTGNIYGHL
jgi:hypothetical protein